MKRDLRSAYDITKGIGGRGIVYLLFPVMLFFLVAAQALPAHGFVGGEVKSRYTDKDKDGGGNTIPRAGTQMPNGHGTVMDSTGCMIMTGYRNLSGGDDDFWTVKFNTDGQTIAWRKSFNKTGGSDQAMTVAVDANDNVIVSGSVWNGFSSDIHTIKYSPAGDVIWQHTYVTPSGGNGMATALATDSLNNIYVGGYVQGSSGTEDFIIIKYLASGPKTDGSPEWTATYNGPANKTDKLASIAVVYDGVGGTRNIVVVTGQSHNGTDFDLFTKTYYADNGQERKNGSNQAIEWRYTSAGNKSGRKVLIDSTDNILVTASVSNATDTDIYTAKYNAADGTIMWGGTGKTYDGGHNDEPYSMVLDGGGNAYVTGYSFTLTGNEDVYTLKYKASDGSTLWAKGYDFGGQSYDRGTDIILDGGGNVYVGGYSVTAAGNNDFLAIKYKADSGDILWHTTVDGPAGKNERPAGIGILPNNGGLVLGGYTDSWTSGVSDYDYFLAVIDQGAIDPPTGLTATVHTGTSSSVDLSWTNAAGSTCTIIQRKLDLEPTWTTLPSVSESDPCTAGVVGGNTFTDTGLATNNVYYYRVLSHNASAGESNPSDEAHVLTLYVTAGVPDWSYIFAGVDDKDDFPSGIAVGPDNNPVVTGYTTRKYSIDESSGLDLYTFDYFTLKLKRDGTLLWSDRYDDVNSQTDIAKGVVVDSANAAVVTGYSYMYPGFGDDDIFSIYTRKYPASCSPPTPCLPEYIWQAQYNGPFGIDDRATTVASAIDASNSVAVVGYGMDALVPNGIANLYLVKYPANPTIDAYGFAQKTWAATPYRGAGDTFPSTVAFDRSGNILVTGYSQKSNGSGQKDFDIFTAKYNGATGAMIWRHIFDGTTTGAKVDAGDKGNDKGLSLDVDLNDNVYVTGSTAIDTEISEGKTVDKKTAIILIKYNGQKQGDGNNNAGQVLWTRTFENTSTYDVTRADDNGVSVKYDQADNTAVVGGTILTAPGDHDFITIKYATNGDKLKQNIHRRPNIDDVAKAMAMDLSGSVSLAGYTSDGLSADALSIKLNYELTLVDATIYDRKDSANPPVSLQKFDEATAVTVNALGETFVSGYTTNATDNADYLIYKMPTKPLQATTPFTATPYYKKVDLIWTDNSTGEYAPGAGGTEKGEAGFTLQWKVDTSNDDNVVNCNAEEPTENGWTTINIAANDSRVSKTVSYSFPGLNYDQKYCYRVRAYNGPAANPTDTTRWVMRNVKVVGPTPPVLNSVTPVNTTRMDLSWTSQTSGETGYKIYRCAGDPCTFPETATYTVTGATTYSDIGVTAGTHYGYKIFAYVSGTANSNWESDFSTPVYGDTPVAKTPVVTAVNAINNGQVTITWTDTNTDNTGYRIRRCEGDGCTDFTTNAPPAAPNPIDSSIAAAVRSYTDIIALKTDTAYRYQVCAFKTTTNAWENCSIATSAVTTTSTAPVLSPLTTPSSTEVKVTWSDTTGGETNFIVERCTGDTTACAGGPFSQVGIVAGGVTSFTDTTACRGTTYTYRVKAVNNGLSGDNGGVWKYRRQVNFSTFKANLLTKVTVTRPANMNANYSDMRFLDETTQREIPYFIETDTSTNPASVSVSLVTGNNNNIYMYYGNTSATSSSSAPSVFGNGLMGYWPFNEAAGTYSGTVADYSGLGNHLTLYSYSAGYGLVSGGILGNYLRQTGNSNARHAAPNVPTGNVVTAEAWIYPTSYGDATYNGIVSWSTRACNGRGFALSMQNSGRPSMPTWCNDFVPGTGATATLNAWNHVAAVINGTSATLYMNGQSIGPQTLTYTPDLSSVNFIIGSLDYPTGRFFSGNIDEVRVYNRALTATEIATRYSATMPTVTISATEQNNASGYAFPVSWIVTNPALNLTSSPLSTTTANPGAPSIVSATVYSETQINLTWNNVPAEATALRVMRCSNGTSTGCTSYSQVGSDLAPTATTFNNTGLTANNYYSYKVVAIKGTAPCPSWNLESAAVADVKTVPAVPTGIASTSSVSYGCEDLRLTDSSGTALLNYYVDSGCGTASTILYANVPSIAASGNTTLYLYGGNTSALPVSSAALTFDFYDDFSGTTIDTASKWVKGDPSAKLSQNDELIAANPAGTWGQTYLYSQAAFTRPFVLELKHKHISGGEVMFGAKNNDANPAYNYYPYAIYPVNGNNLYVYESGSYRGQNFAPIATNTWEYYRLEVLPSAGAKYYVGTSPSNYSLFYTSAYSSATPLKIGIDNANMQFRLDDVRVRKLASPLPATAIGAKTFTTYSLTGGTWNYRRPVTVTGNGTALSNYQHLITLDTSADQSDRAVLTWTDKTSTETGFTIERCTIDGSNACTAGTFTAMDTFTMPSPDTGGINRQMTYADRTIVPATSYCYRVKANLPSGDTDFTDPPTCPAATVAPVGMLGKDLTATLTGTQVALSWSDSSTNEDGFQIERCKGAGCTGTFVNDTGFPVKIGANATATVSWTDTTTCSGNTYYYRVKSLKPWVATWPTDYSNLKETAINTPPSPTSVTASRVSETQINLTWSYTPADESAVQVWRCTGDSTVCYDNSKYFQVGSDLPKPVAATGSYSDTGLNPLTTYTYQVRAVKYDAVCGWSAPSALSGGRIETAVTTTPAPTSLAATPASSTQVNLSFTDAAVSDSGFKIQRCSGAGCTDFSDWKDISSASLIQRSYKAFYSFNNTLNDSSGNGLHLTGSAPTYEDGGLALTTATTFQSPTTSILDNNNHAIEFDIKFRSTATGWPKIFSFNAGGSDRSPGIWQYSNVAMLHWRYDPGNTGFYYLGVNGENNTAFTVGKWYRIRGVKSGATFTTYVNGIQVGSVAAANPKTAGATTLWFGGADVTLKNFSIEGDVITYAKNNNVSITDDSVCAGTTYNYRIVANNNFTGDGGAGNNWTSYIPLTIANFQQSFQTRVVVPWNPRMKADFSDIRFYDTTAKLALPYWIENKTDGSTATVWFKTGGNNTISMYYGNPNAVSTSSAASVFEFFDDFTTLNTAVWSKSLPAADITLDASGSGTVRINNGALYSIAPVLSSPQNMVFEMKNRWTGTTTSTTLNSSLSIADTTSLLGNNAGGNAKAENQLSYNSAEPPSRLQAIGANGTAASNNLGSTQYAGSLALNTDRIVGFEFTGTSISYFAKDPGTYTDQGRLALTGAWDKPPYMILGNGLGKNAGTADAWDMIIDWVRTRKYAATEPVVSLGVEQPPSVSTSLTASTIWQWSGKAPVDIAIASFLPNTATRITIPAAIVGGRTTVAQLNDLRFYDDTAHVELPNWAGNMNPDGTANVWIKTGVNNTITLYYGNQAAVSNSNASAVFGPNLVGFWPFEEPLTTVQPGSVSYSTKDASGNNPNGALMSGSTSGITYSTTPIIGTDGITYGPNGIVSNGIYGSNALKVYGDRYCAYGATGYYASIPAPLGSPLNVTGSMSIDFWYYYPSSGPLNNSWLVSKVTTNTGAAPWALYAVTFNNAKLGFLVNSIDGPGFTQLSTPASTNTLIPNSWNHVVARYNNDPNNLDLSITVNGIKTAKATPFTPIEIATNVQPFSIGSRGLNTNNAFGEFDEVRFYNRWLTDDEVASRFAPPAGSVVMTSASINTPSASLSNAGTISGGGNGVWTTGAPLSIVGFQPNFATRLNIPPAYAGAMKSDLSDLRFYDTVAGVELPYWIETKNINIGSFATTLSNAGGGTWTQRQPLAIANFQPNFPTRFNVPADAVVEMKSDLSDLRFYDYTANAEIPYYIQSISGTPATATVMLKTGANNTIAMYYGNPSATATSSRDAVFGTGLVGYWPFEEVSGTATGNTSDVSGNYRNGALTGFVTNYGVLLGGKPGNGLSLNGTSSYVSVPDAGVTDPLRIDGSMTVELWYKHDSTNMDNAMLVKKSDTTGNINYSLYIPTGADNNFRNLIFRVTDGTTTNITAPVAGITNDKLMTDKGAHDIWYHVVGRYDATTGKIDAFINGVNTATANGTANVTARNADSELRFGRSSGASVNYLKGAIDEVRIYSRALSDPEIASRYAANQPVAMAAGTPVSTSNPTVWLKTGVNNNIMMYYGNNVAAPVSNKDSAKLVFDYFDDFTDLNGWSKSAASVNIVKGTASAASSATSLQDDGTSTGGSWTAADYYKDYYLLIMAVADPGASPDFPRKALVGQYRKIVGNTTGKLFSIDPADPFPVAIGAGDTYQIVYDPTVPANVSDASLTGSDSMTLTRGSLYTKTPVINSSPINKVFEIRNRWTNDGGSGGGLTVSNTQFATTGNGNSNNELFFAHADLRIGGSGLQSIASNGVAKTWNVGSPTLTYDSGAAPNSLANAINRDWITGIEFRGTNDIYYSAKDPASYVPQYYKQLNSTSGSWAPVYPCYANPQSGCVSPYASPETKPYIFLGHIWGYNAGIYGQNPINVDWVRVRGYASIEPSVTIGSSQPFSGFTGGNGQAWTAGAPLTFTTFQANAPARIVIPSAQLNAMKGDLSDLRFYDATAKVELPHWYETKNGDPATSAIVWLKTGANNAIFMYYGNPGATAVSSKTAVFGNRALAPATGMVAFWPFEEAVDTTSGPTADYSGNNLSGDITNGAAIISGGFFDNGLSLDGASNYVSVTDSTGSPLDITGNMTIELWYRFDKECASYKYLLSKQHDNGGYLYTIYTNESKGLKFKVGDGTTQQIVDTGSSVPMVDGNWYHVVAKYDKTISPAAMSLFVNGQRVAYTTYASPVTIATSDRPITIGGLAASAYAKGVIDEVRIYNRALTDAEIAARVSVPPTIGTSFQVLPVSTWNSSYSNVVSAVTQASGNVVNNMNFESGSTGWTLGSAAATVDTSTAVNGTSSVKITSTTLAPRGQEIVSQALPQLTPGGSYTLSGNVKASLNNGYAFCRVVANNGSWDYPLAEYAVTSPTAIVWNKTNNSIPAGSDSASSDGRIALGVSSGGAGVPTSPYGTPTDRGDTGSVLGSAVIKEDANNYRMWYVANDHGTGGSNRVYYATSTDGQTWTKVDTTLPPIHDTGAVPTNNNGRVGLGSDVAGIGDRMNIYTPAVIKDVLSDNVTPIYKMWYAGHDRTNWRIYYATSPDGLNWTKYDNSVPDRSNTTGTNGRIPLGATGSGDSTHVLAPTVVKDITTTPATYKMWYTGHDGSYYRIFMATSTDGGVTWAKRNNLSTAARDSGVTPTDNSGQIPLGSSGKGDDYLTYYPSVIWEGGSTYKMWYAGAYLSAYNNPSPRYTRIMSAISYDGGLNWTKLDNTVIGPSDGTSTNSQLTYGTALKGDSFGPLAPFVLKEGDNTYTMWYSGITGGNVSRIYRATTSDNGVTWVKQDNSIPARSNTTGTNGRIPQSVVTAGDTFHTAFPAVIQDGTNSYKMWYSASDGMTWRIYYATSTDGLNWTKQDSTVPAVSDGAGTNGRIGIGSAGKGDGFHVFTPSVVKEAANIYKMWYSGHDGLNWRGIFMATSPDGLTWTKTNNTTFTTSPNQILDTNATGPGGGRLFLGTLGDSRQIRLGPGSVILDGSTYKMWYAGFDGYNWRIYLATSTDGGQTWKKQDNSVPTDSDTTSTNGRIPKGTAGKGDSKGTINPSVYKDGSTYRMWYAGSDGSDVWRIFHATSTDGLTWTKQDNSLPAPSDDIAINGRIPVGNDGKGDGMHIQGASVIKDGSIFRMWFTGNDQSVPQRQRIFNAVQIPNPANLNDNQWRSFSVPVSLKTSLSAADAARAKLICGIARDNSGAATDTDTAYFDMVQLTASNLPLYLTATRSSESQINLSWADTYSDETGFSVERCSGVSCSAFTQIATLAAKSTSYSDVGLAPGTYYSYRITAFKTAACNWTSNYSNIATAQTSIASMATPSVPTLTVTVGSATQLNLSWTNTVSGHAGFSIERCDGVGCNFVCANATCSYPLTSQKGTVASNVTTFNNTGLTSNATYSYRIRAYNADNTWNGGYSNVATATTNTTSSTITTSVLSASVANTTQINLDWMNMVSNESGYKIERCTGTNCTFSTIDPGFPMYVSPNSTNYNDTTVCNGSVTPAPPGPPYSYRIYAANESGPSNSGGGSWTKRAMVNISNFQANLPIRMTIDKPDSMLSFNEMRFIDIGSGAELPYWIENIIPAADGYPEKVNVWIKAGTNNSVYLYYGNTSATSVSSVTGVFGTGLVGYWPFNETAGTNTGELADRSGYNPALPMNANFNYNILANGGFESSSTSWTTAVGTTTGTSFDDVGSGGIAYDESKSLKLTATGAVLGRAQTVSVTAGKAYTLAGYIKSALTAGSAKCDVYGGTLDSAGISSGSSSWTKASETVTIPAGTTSVQIRCFADSAPQGQAWFDNIQFYPAMDLPYGIVAGGRYSNGLSLNGANNVMTVPDVTNSPVDITGALTVEVWYQYQTGPAWSRIVTKPTTGGVQPWDLYGIYLNDPAATGNQQQAAFVVSNTNQWTAPTAPPIGQSIASATGPNLVPGNWYHIVGRWNPSYNTTSKLGEAAIFVNGVKYANTASTITLATSNEPLSFGSLKNYGAYTKGVIDEVRLYNRALSDSEIAAHYAATIPSVTGLGQEEPVSASSTALAATLVNEQFNDDSNIGSSATWTMETGHMWREINQALTTTSPQSIDYTDPVRGQAKVSINSTTNDAAVNPLNSSALEFTTTVPNPVPNSSLTGLAGPNYAMLYMKTPEALGDEFDIQFDYSIPADGYIADNLPTSPKSRSYYAQLRIDTPSDGFAGNQFIIERSTAQDPNDGYIYKNCYLVSMTSGGAPAIITVIPTADTSGTLRISKVGNVVNFYKNTIGNSTWGVPLASLSNANHMPPTGLYLIQYLRFQEQPGTRMRALIDNIKITRPNTTQYSYSWNYTPAASGYSNVVANLTPTVPVAPTGVTATVTNDTQATVSWTDTNTDETGFKVWKCIPVSPATTCTPDYTTAPFMTTSGTSFTASGLDSSATHCFSVKAYKNSICRWDSPASTITATSCDTTIPARPVLSVASKNSLANELTWAEAATATDVTGYEVQTKLKNITWITIAKVMGKDNMSYIDSAGIDPGKTYTYRVRNFRSVTGHATEYSPYSNEASITTPGYSSGDGAVCH